MKENFLEQTKTEEKIKILKEEAERSLIRIFDDRDNLEKNIHIIIQKVEHGYQNGFVFDMGFVVEGLKNSISIKDRKEFVAYCMKVLEPIIPLRFTQPKIWERLEREETIRGETVNSEGNIKLSEVLYARIDGGMADIHLALATQYTKEGGIANFKEQIINGLKNLAEKIKNRDDIKEVSAFSWIIAKHPLLIKSLGFKIENRPPEEEVDGYSGEKRLTAGAFMDKEDFLKRYGNN